MRNILFVDDNPKVLQRFKEMLQPLRQEWKIEFVSSGNEALKSFDVVVADMDMPDMDGVKLLDIVMERFPESVRVIISEQSDKETMLRSARIAHQFLKKSCSLETMKYAIEHACKPRDILRDKMLRKIVTGIKDLPSLPDLYGLIVKEMQSPEASLKKVGYIISQDVSMSAKILQLVNSAYFGLPRKITDPQQASVFLGTDTLKALILSIHVFSSFAEGVELYGLSLAEMWRHSMTVGRLASSIVSSELVEREIVEEALVAGILHDIGKLVMLKIPEQYRQIREFIGESGSGFVEAEYAVMKTSHAELGAYLLGLWGIPDNIVVTVAFHHRPSKLLEDMFIISSKSNGEITDKTKPDNNSGIPSFKGYFAGFDALTAVHVANSLIMQENITSNTAVFPYIDMQYLKTLNLTNKLPKWAACCEEIKKEQI